MARRTETRLEFLMDCIVTAVEGGIGYWSQVSEYRWDRDKWSDNQLGVTVHPDDESEGEFETKRITPDDIASALGVIRRTDAETLQVADYYRRTIMNIDDTNNGETGDLISEDMDAGIADMIMQVAVIGKVIFG